MDEEKIKCLSDTECDGTIEVIKIDYKTKVGRAIVNVPNVEIWICSKCGEKFFPVDSSRKIEKYRKYPGKFMLRLGPELHYKLAERANKNRRNKNNEIIHILEEVLMKESNI